MRKIFLSIAIFLSVVTVSNAQNTSPFWSLAGNSNATSTSKLGTTNNISLRFYTNNVQRMIINSAAGLVGIGTTTPDSRLHVNSSAGQNAIRAQVNGATKFLVDDGGGVSVGSNTTPPANGLYVAGNVGIGTAVPSYKLHVVSSGTAIYGNTTGNGNAVYGYGGSTGIGVRGLSDYIAIYGDGDTYGVEGFSGAGYGVYGHSGSGYGVRGYSNDGYGGYFQSFSNYGVYATGYRGVYGKGNIGIDGFSDNDGGDGVHGFAYGGSGYGVYGYSALAIGVLGTSGSASSYAGYFNGKVYSSGGYTSSDRKLKQDITTVTNAMDIILKLQPKTYKFRQDGNYKLMNLPVGKHYGLIAQDVEAILPDLVNDAKFETKMAQPDAREIAGQAQSKALDTRQSSFETIEFKALNYTELVPIIIKGMQELNEKNDEKDKLIRSLQNQINDLKSLISKSGNGTLVTSSTAFLKQNIPNPANNNTIISYYIPDNTGSAQIKITDVKGSLIKTFNTAKGEGRINIRRGELPAGTYNYTLYINNKTVDTRQMVLIK